MYLSQHFCVFKEPSVQAKKPCGAPAADDWQWSVSERALRRAMEDANFLQRLHRQRNRRPKRPEVDRPLAARLASLR